MPDLFTKEERAAWGGLIVTQSRLFAAIEEDLRRHHGITHTEFEVLLRLWTSEGGRMRIQELADRSLLTRSGTSRAVDRLVRAGHLAREGAAEDGRGAYAVLTPSGRAHFEVAAEAHTALVRRMFLSHLDADDLAALAAIWRKAAAGARGPG